MERVLYISEDAFANAVLEITNKEHIIIDGLTFTRDNAKNNAVGLLIQSSANNNAGVIEIKNCVFTRINWSTNPNVKPTGSQNSQPLIVYGRSSAAITNINIHDCDSTIILQGKVKYAA